MSVFFKAVLQKIEKEEKSIKMEPDTTVKESLQMVYSLNQHLKNLREYLQQKVFDQPSEEIHFFRNVKPLIYGKLLYYHKVFRIESGRPANIGNAYISYYHEKLEKQKELSRRKFQDTEFYRYYRSGLTELDSEFFIRGKIKWASVKRYLFDIDQCFSTWYDQMVAKIIESDLLIEFLHTRIFQAEQADSEALSALKNKTMVWTDSKAALIELIYALHANQSISNGDLEIRKTVSLFQMLFGVHLGDVHHAFHRMKTRSGERSFFLNKLKDSLELYMDRDL